MCLEKLIIYHKPDLFERIKLPLSIGIVGESASGKSTITEDFIKVLSRYWTVNRINTDDYYYDNSEAVKKGHETRKKHGIDKITNEKAAAKRKAWYDDPENKKKFKAKIAERDAKKQKKKEEQ